MKKIIIIISSVIVFLLVGTWGFFIGKSFERNQHMLGNNQFVRFYAKITSINGDQVLVEGIPENDINHRGEFDFTIEEDTKILAYNLKTKVSKQELKPGDEVLVVYHGPVMERYPAGIMDVDLIVVYK